MATTINTFTTQAGTRYFKKKDTLDRTYYVKEGEGRIKPQSYSGAAGHTTAGELERGTIDETDLTERTDFSAPYNAASMYPIEAFEEGSEARAQVAEANKFYGFFTAEGTSNDRLEAMREYREMVQRLAETDDPERQEEIKRDYNIGGSE